MEKLEVTIVDGGCSGIEPTTLRRIIEAAQNGEPVILSLNHDGKLTERKLRDDELAVLHEAEDTLNEKVSFSIRSLVKRDVSQRVAICGGSPIGDVAAFALAQQMKDINPEKDYPFRGNQRKYIPPRRINARGLPKRSYR